MHIERLEIQAERFPDNSVYPFNLAVLQNTRSLRFDSPITFFIGENGSGKSTLLKAIAYRCGIHIWKGFERTRFEVNPHEDELYRYISVDWRDGTVPGAFFASEIFRNFSQLLDEWAAADPGILDYFGSKSLMTQSHGQSHLAFFESRFGIEGLYLLDEPENALSPRSQLRLVDVLRQMARAGHAQFIVATHSPILLTASEADIFSFDSSPIQTYRVF